MRICLFCATRRGLRFLKALKTITPESDLCVFSFPETPWEPHYFYDIRDYCDSIDAEFYQARNVAAPQYHELWEKQNIDLMFCVSWRYMIPPSIYERSTIGSYVFHDSLLPKYRGFSPTVWAMLNGEHETGVTLFEIAETVDSGRIIDQRPIAISRTETIADILEKVTVTYLKLLEKNFKSIVEGNIRPYEQDSELATYCCKLTPDDVKIDWTWTTERIFNMIRAYGPPYPGAYFYYGDEKIHIIRAEPIQTPKHYSGRIPGRIVNIDKLKGITVLSGDGEICIQAVKTANGDEQNASDIISSFAKKLN